MLDKPAVIVGGLAVLAAWIAPIELLGQDPIDRAAMVTTALDEFETPNGPIVAVLGRLHCEAQGADPSVPCPDSEADSVLARFAEEHDATLVPAEAPQPHCQWSDADTSDRNGLVLLVRMHEPADRDGKLWVDVETRCRSSWEPFPQFVHIKRYPFELVDGEWKRHGEVIVIIT